MTKRQLKQSAGDRTFRMNQKREYICIDYNAAEIDKIIKHVFTSRKASSQGVKHDKET